MENHVKILGILYIIFSALLLFTGILLFITLAGGGLISQDAQALAITTLIGTILAFFFIILSLPGLIGGFGLLKYWNWARILVIVLAILNLFNIPFGTALGIYSLWILFKPEAIVLFEQKYAYQPPPSGPPPQQPQ